jgi:SAM-dependent methyltransferase
MKFFDIHEGKLPPPDNFRDVMAPLERMTKKNFGKTLDIGCASTWVANCIEDYYGIDVNQGLLEWARNYWVQKNRWTHEEAANRVKWVSSIAIPFPDQQFDTVIARDVLEHVDQNIAFFVEMIRVLKPGGLIYLSCPDSQKHVWDEPTHRRPYPLKAQLHLASLYHLTVIYQGYESVLPGTQKLAKFFGGRSPAPFRLFWRLPWWPRNAVTICRK